MHLHHAHTHHDCTAEIAETAAAVGTVAEPADLVPYLQDLYGKRDRDSDKCAEKKYKYLQEMYINMFPSVLYWEITWVYSDAPSYFF